MTRIGSRLDDLINPIAIKELRQAVQSRTITILLMLFLAVQVLVAWLMIVGNDLESSFEGGKVLFGVLNVILQVACMICIPLYAAARFSAERRGENGDLYFISAISSGAIIRGKFSSSMSLVVLLNGAFLPFMTFCYLLRGVDLPTIFLVLVIGILFSVSMISFSLLLACIRMSGMLRVLVGLVLLGCGIWAVVGHAAMTFGMIYGDVSIVAYAGIGVLGFYGLYALSFLLGIGANYTLAVALLKPPSANRVLSVRLYFTAVWLIVGGVGWLVYKSTGYYAWAYAWMIFTTGFLVFATGVAISEREDMSRRVRRQVPRFSLLRIPAFLFYSGSAGGITWILLLFGTTAVCSSILVDNISHGMGMIRKPHHAEPLMAMILLTLYALCYGMTAVLVRRWFFRKTSTQYTWLFALMLLLIGIVVPMFFGYLESSSRHRFFREDAWYMFGNPFMSFEWAENQSDFFAALTFLGFWGGIVALCSIKWWLGQVVNFHPMPKVQNASIEKETVVNE